MTKPRDLDVAPTCQGQDNPSIPVDKWQHVQLVLSEHGPVSASERLVLLAISADTNDSQLEGWPSQSRIAERVQLGQRQVKRLVKAAEDHGWLRRRRARKPGATWSFTIYSFSVPESLVSAIRIHPWDSDPTWKQGDKLASPSFEQGDKLVSPTPPSEGFSNGCKVTSKASEVTNGASKVTNGGGSKVTNGASKVTSGWPTMFPSDVSIDVPIDVSPHGARRTARATGTGQISESPEVQRKRREAAELVRKLAEKTRL